MKANQVYSFFKGFKFSKNFLLMNYKLNKILSQTSKRNADLSHTNSWGHKLHHKHTFWGLYRNRETNDPISIHSKSNFLIKDWNESQPSLQLLCR